MTIMITKADSGYWVRFRDFDTIESLFQYIKEIKYDILLTNNPYFGDEPFEIMKFWEGLTEEKAKLVSECEYKIIIHNWYLE